MSDSIEQFNIEDLMTEQGDVKLKKVRKYMFAFREGRSVESINVIMCPISGNLYVPDGNYRCLAQLMLHLSVIDGRREVCEYRDELDCDTDICYSYTRLLTQVVIRK